MSGKRLDYITLDDYFMGIAELSRKRSKDPRTQVGACVASKDNYIISTGYNGTPGGMSDDDMPWDSLGEETGDLMNIKNTFVVHAEQNAILNPEIDGSRLKGATMYVTLFPCNECAKIIAKCGIKRVIYLEMYKRLDLVEATKKIFDCAGIEYVPFHEEIKENGGSVLIKKRFK